MYPLIAADFFFIETLIRYFQAKAILCMLYKLILR